MATSRLQMLSPPGGGCRDDGPAAPADSVSNPQNTPQEINYQLWAEGTRPTPVNCFQSAAGSCAEEFSDGVFRQYMKLESSFPFNVLHTITLVDGPMSGCQVIVVKPETPFPFLRLPRELRDQIYTYAMVPEAETVKCPSCGECKDNRIFFNRTGKRVIPMVKVSNIADTNDSHFHYCNTYLEEVELQPFTTKHSLTPGLLLVSHQIYDEALPVLYGENTFSFSFNLDFFQKIGPAIKYIRTLSLSAFGSVGLQTTKELLAKLPHLKLLNIEDPDDWIDSFANSPLNVAAFFFRRASNWINEAAELREDRFAAVGRVNMNFEDSRFHDHDYDENGYAITTSEEIRHAKEEMSRNFQAELKKLMTIASGPPLPFLRLPRKVRNKIYEYAMVQWSFWQSYSRADPPRGISIRKIGTPARRVIEDFGYDGSKDEEDRTDGFEFHESFTPGLLLVNRQVYQEYVQVLYGVNNFIMKGPGALEAFVSGIGHSHIYLRSVGIEHYPDNCQAWAKLAQVTRLTLEMKPWWTSYANSTESIPPSKWIYDSAIDPQEAARTFYRSALAWIESARNLNQTRSQKIKVLRFSGGGHGRRGESREWRRSFRSELDRAIAENDAGWA